MTTGICDGQHAPDGIALDVEPPPITAPRRCDGAGPPIIDDGEPLRAVDGPRLSLLNLYHRRGWPGTSPVTWARAGTVERLNQAASLLPDDFGLAVFDAWRSTATVRALYDAFYGPNSALPAGFLADPDDPTRVPPHSTGGAVDVTLAHRGAALALGTCFDEFSPTAHTLALEGDPHHPSRALRRLLHDVMARAGFAALPEEWWHFSYGDQAWAHHTGAASTPYGATEPDAGGASRR